MSMHSGGFELTKLTYTRLEDNLIRHPGDRTLCYSVIQFNPFSHHTPTFVWHFELDYNMISLAGWKWVNRQTSRHTYT